MLLDIAGRGTGRESRFVDQQRFVLDRSVWREAMGWDLVLEDL